MIISVSRRTDIPAFYAEWFYNRLRAGYVLVRNPMNVHSVSKVALSPEVVDAFVFWTKNPLPLMKRLDELAEYPYYFQFTLTGYEKDIEPGLPDKKQVLLPAFKELAAKTGRQRVIWRYDPIFFSSRYSMEYHLECYSSEEIYAFAARLAKIADKYGLKLQTCAETEDFTPLGITASACIDKDLIENIGGFKLKAGKDKNQRPECCCAASIDIGVYNTCPGGCLYCYANYNAGMVKINCAAHNKTSPLLFGKLSPQDVVTERKMKSCKDYDTELFDV